MIYAVDPGVRDTGIVGYDEDGERVEFAVTVKYGERVETQEEHATMCRGVCERVHSTLRSLGYDPCRDVLVVEGFEYLGGTFHASSLKTVFLVGALMREFPEAWWQTSAQVLNPLRKGNHRHIKDNPRQVAGGELCTNDHERSALAHAVHFADEARFEQRSLGI